MCLGCVCFAGVKRFLKVVFLVFVKTSVLTPNETGGQEPRVCVCVCVCVCFRVHTQEFARGATNPLQWPRPQPEHNLVLENVLLETRCPIKVQFVWVTSE